MLRAPARARSPRRRAGPGNGRGGPRASTTPPEAGPGCPRHPGAVGEPGAAPQPGAHSRHARRFGAAEASRAPRGRRRRHCSLHWLRAGGASAAGPRRERSRALSHPLRDPPPQRRNARHGPGLVGPGLGRAVGPGRGGEVRRDAREPLQTEALPRHASLSATLLSSASSMTPAQRLGLSGRSWRGLLNVGTLSDPYRLQRAKTPRPTSHHTLFNHAGKPEGAGAASSGADCPPTIGAAGIGAQREGPAGFWDHGGWGLKGLVCHFVRFGKCYSSTSNFFFGGDL